MSRKSPANAYYLKAVCFDRLTYACGIYDKRPGRRWYIDFYTSELTISTRRMDPERGKRRWGFCIGFTVVQCKISRHGVSPFSPNKAYANTLKRRSKTLLKVILGPRKRHVLVSMEDVIATRDFKIPEILHMLSGAYSG